MSEFICNKCNHEFLTKSNLNRHLKKKNTCIKENDSLLCEFCNLKFSRQDSKARHEKSNKHKLQFINYLNLNDKDKTNLSNSCNLINKDKKILEIYEYIYIITNAQKELLNIFKIGRTCNLDNRKGGYNTGCVDGIDKHYYKSYYKCTKANSLEKRIFDLLKPFKIGNELYQIEFKVLDNIIKNICEIDLKTTLTINNYLSKLTIE